MVMLCIITYDWIEVKEVIYMYYKLLFMVLIFGLTSHKYQATNKFDGGLFEHKIEMYNSREY
jgi:hypothetical protein